MADHVGTTDREECGHWLFSCGCGLSCGGFASREDAESAWGWHLYRVTRGAHLPNLN